MTQEELETKVQGVQRVLELSPDLNELLDDQIHALLAWEYWKDGADWNDLVVDMITGQYLPFNTRESAIKALKEIFGY